MTPTPQSALMPPPPLPLRLSLAHRTHTPPIFSLPHEIHDLILSELSDSLPALALTSRYFHNIIVPRHSHYRHLRLRKPHHALWAHLARRADLARGIRSVHLCEERNYTAPDRVPRFVGEEDPVDLDEGVRIRNMALALSHMDRLHTFVWSANVTVFAGRPTAHREHEVLILAMVAAKPTLVNLSLVGRFGTHVHNLALDPTSTQYPVWNMTNLNRLCLSGDEWVKLGNAPHVARMLTRSPNLEYLSIPLEFPALAHPHLTLPNLKTIKLYLQSGATASIDESRTRFLERHDAIEELCWFPIGNIHFSRPGCLRNLKRLKTCRQVLIALEEVEMEARMREAEMEALLKVKEVEDEVEDGEAVGGEERVEGSENAGDGGEHLEGERDEGELEEEEGHVQEVEAATTTTTTPTPEADEVEEDAEGHVQEVETTTTTPTPEADEESSSQISSTSSTPTLVATSPICTSHPSHHLHKPPSKPPHSKLNLQSLDILSITPRTLLSLHTVLNHAALRQLKLHSFGGSVRAVRELARACPNVEWLSLPGFWTYEYDNDGEGEGGELVVEAEDEALIGRGAMRREGGREGDHGPVVVDGDTWLSLLPLFPRLHTFRGQALWHAVGHDMPALHMLIIRLVLVCPNLTELDHRDWCKRREGYKRIVISREYVKDGEEEEEGEFRVSVGDGDGKGNDLRARITYAVKRPHTKDSFDAFDGVFD